MKPLSSDTISRACTGPAFRALDGSMDKPSWPSCPGTTGPSRLSLDNQTPLDLQSLTCTSLLPQGLVADHRTIVKLKTCAQIQLSCGGLH